MGYKLLQVGPFFACYDDQVFEFSKLRRKEENERREDEKYF
jgi:hypothetical protein